MVLYLSMYRVHTTYELLQEPCSLCGLGNPLHLHSCHHLHASSCVHCIACPQALAWLGPPLLIKVVLWHAFVLQGGPQGGEDLCLGQGGCGCMVQGALTGGGWCLLGGRVYPSGRQSHVSDPATRTPTEKHLRSTAASSAPATIVAWG